MASAGFVRRTSTTPGGTVTTLDDRAGTTTEGPSPVAEGGATTEVSFDTSPERYRHWTLTTDGEIATLTLDVAEDGGIVPGYELKMNSYDLGVDIELHDAVQRIRFEHPEVKAVVVTSAKARMFCAGANIKMLAASPHSWKVNFCKFTNETRNGLEDASAHSGLHSIAAVNGTAAAGAGARRGGGREGRGGRGRGGGGGAPTPLRGGLGPRGFPLLGVL